jgi:CheY-like chemotaxis protein
MTNAAVLIVDDDAVYAELLMKALASALPSLTGRLTFAPMGDAALTELRENPDIAAVILDMMVPLNSSDTSGALPPAIDHKPHGALIAVRMAETGLDMSRVIVITAIWSDALDADLRSIGVVDIFRKPVETYDIVRALSSILHGRRGS